MSILNGRLGRFLVAVVAIVVCILGTSMVVQVATIDGHRALVNRLAYRWSTPHRGDALALYYPVKPDRVFDSLVLAEDGSNGASNGSRERRGSIRAPGRPWREASVPVAQFARLAACENWQRVSPTGDPGPCPFPPG